MKISSSKTGSRLTRDRSPSVVVVGRADANAFSCARNRFFRDLPRNRMDRSTGKDAGSRLARHHAFTGTVFSIIMQRNSNTLSASCIYYDRQDEIIYQEHLSHRVPCHAGLYSTIGKRSTYDFRLFIGHVYDFVLRPPEKASCALGWHNKTTASILVSPRDLG